jgi:transcriptional regulator with XRE-family HTH domain
MTAKDLKDTRERLKLTQAEMSAKLGCKSLSTYRNWEQGVSPVPAWVDDKILPPEIALEGFSFDELARLEKIAKIRGDGSTALSVALEFVRAGIKAALSIALLIVFVHQICHPEEQLARRFGARRKGEANMMVDPETDA